MAQKWFDSIEKQKKQFEIFAKIAQISLPWQQIKNLRTTFCRVSQGELMAQKWRDSIEKQKRRISLKERDTQTDGQTDRVNC